MGCKFSVQVKPWNSPKQGGSTKNLLLPTWSPSIKQILPNMKRGVVPAPPLSQSATPPLNRSTEKVALIIGINKYKHWPALECAASDATEVAAVLQGLNFKVKTLIDKKASRDAILRELEQCMCSGTFVVALFGHGIEINGSAMFVPADAAKEGESDKIHTDALKGMSKRSGASSGLFLFDCCFSGAFLAARKTRTKSWVGTLTRERSRIVITSGVNGETVDDNDGTGHSPFTTALLASLKDAEKPLSAIQLFVAVRTFAINRYHGMVIPKLGRFPGDEGGDTFLM